MRLCLTRVFQCLFTFVLIGENLTAQSTGSHRGIGGGIQIPETVASSPSFFLPRHQSTPESLLAGYGLSTNDHVIFGCHQQTEKF